MSAVNRTCVSGMAALAWELPEEIAMYARTGADLVGLPIAKVVGFGVARTAELLAAHGVRVGYLVQAFSAHPEDDAGWERELATLVSGIRAAQDLGAEVVYLTSGPSARLDWEDAADHFAGRLTPAVAEARARGIRLALENTLPIKADISFTHSAAETFALAERLGIGVCLDLYCCWQERGLTALLAARVAQIEILQLSDFVVGTSTFPNRWVPGDADLPLPRLLAAALGAGYAGIVDIELIGPAIEAEGAESALIRSVAWLRAQLASAQTLPVGAQSTRETKVR